MLCVTSLVEHDFWNGSFLHRDDRKKLSRQPAGFPTKHRKCEHHRITPSTEALGDMSEYSPYSPADRKMFQAIEVKVGQTGQVSENDLEGGDEGDDRERGVQDHLSSK